MNLNFFFFTNKHSQVTLGSQLCLQFKKFKFGGIALLTHFKLCGQSCHSSYIPPTTFSLPKMIKSHVVACLHCSLAKPCTTKPKLYFFFFSFFFFSERAETHLEAAWQSSRHQRARQETSCRSCVRQVSPRDRHSNQDGAIGWGNCRGERGKKNTGDGGRKIIKRSHRNLAAGGVERGSVCVCTHAK